MIFLSVEDYVPGEKDFYVPDRAERIYITRSVLSTVASRITYNVRRAKDGFDRGDMKIDEAFFSLVRSLRDKHTENTHLWDYDRWLHDGVWRREFLGDLNLTDDIVPKVGTFGGGSSFTGQDVDILSLLSDLDRWRNIDWPKRVVSLIEENKDLLNHNEEVFITALN